jgi:DNA-binding IclR family transcriptional regulator
MVTLKAVKEGASIPKDVVEATGQPMFRVRSGLRELVNAGFLELVDDKYALTVVGKQVLE